MKRPVAVLVLLALAAFAAAPAAAGKRPSSLRRGLDLSLDGPAHVPAHGAQLTRDNLSLSSVTDDGLSRSLRSGEITAAQFALERVEGAFDGQAKGELSLMLSDLALRVRDLRGVERARALALLARPTDPGKDVNIDNFSYGSHERKLDCSAHFCIHWVETGRHAVAATDADGNSTPDYVDSVLTEMENVWGVQVDDLGFKAPKPDLTSDNTATGPDAGKLDVYLVDSGSEGVYGYCGTDDPNLLDPRSGYEYFDASSYCGLDNDFRSTQFGGAQPIDSLRVTAAHEFFHAIQLAYAAGHDTWLAEGTAALIEDVVYDEINDNYQYLTSSSLRQPNAPLDYGQASFHYGVWIFWRYLTEVSPEADGAPLGTEIIRQVWEQARLDGPGAPGYYSTVAMTKALANRGVSFPAAKSFFSVVNYVPEAFYEEGAAYLEAVGGRRPPLMGTFTLSSRRKSTGKRVARLDHLSAGYVAFKPGTGVRKLKVAVDLPAGKTAPRASVLTLGSDGSAGNQPIAVDSSGVGSVVRIPFKKGETRMVVLVLDNASTRFARCYRAGTPWTCSGVPVDDGLPFTISATAG